MAYPSSLDSFTNPASTDKVSTVDHAAQHSNANNAITALEAKVGADSSAVTTSHDYKLGEVTGTDKAVGKTATQTLTNKTLTAPTIVSFANANHSHQNSAGGGTLAEAALVLADVTTNDVSTSKHGFVPKAPNDTTKFLRGDGAWQAPPSGFGYTLTSMSLVNASLADSTTYYHGSQIRDMQSTTADRQRIYVPIAGTITKIDVTFLVTETLATTEASTVSLRLNNTTDTTVSSSALMSANVNHYQATTSIAVVAGDYFEFKIVTPAWVTNPGSIYFYATVYIA
jgi:hypothetical protein